MLYRIPVYPELPVKSFGNHRFEEKQIIRGALLNLNIATPNLHEFFDCF